MTVFITAFALLLIAGLVFVFVTRRQRQPVPYTGPCIYVTTPATDKLHILQAGPTVFQTIQLPLYISNLLVTPGGDVYARSGNGVNLIDQNAGTMVATPKQFGFPTQIYFLHDGKTVVTVHQLNHPVLGDFFEVRTYALDTEIMINKQSFSGKSSGSALAPDHKSLWIGSLTAKTIEQVDLQSLQVITTFNFATELYPFLINPTGIILYALGQKELQVHDKKKLFNEISYIDLGSGAIVTSFLLNQGGKIEASTDGKYLFIYHGQLDVFNAYTGQLVTTLEAEGTKAVSVHPNGSLAFSIGGNHVMIFDQQSFAFIDIIPLLRPHRQLEIAPDGSRGYALDSNNLLSILDLDWDASGRELASITTGKKPTQVVLNEATQKAYVLNETDNTITVVDTISRTIANLIPIGLKTTTIICNQNGTKLYGTAKLTDGGNYGIWMYDLIAGIRKDVKMPFVCQGLAFDTKQLRIFTVLSQMGKVGVISTNPLEYLGAFNYPNHGLGNDVQVLDNRLFVLTNGFGGRMYVYDATYPTVLRKEIVCDFGRQILGRQEPYLLHLLTTTGHIQSFLWDDDMVLDYAFQSILPQAIKAAVSPDKTGFYVTSSTQLLSYIIYPEGRFHPLASVISGTYGIAVERYNTRFIKNRP
jgi:DNA-binding beta-propeller fold protein YncE